MVTKLSQPPGYSKHTLTCTFSQAVHTYTHTHMLVHMLTHTNTHAYTHFYMHSHTCTHTRELTHVPTVSHAHTCTQICVCSPYFIHILYLIFKFSESSKKDQLETKIKIIWRVFMCFRWSRCIRSGSFSLLIGPDTSVFT